MLSVSYMAQTNYGYINRDLLKIPRTQSGREILSYAYENHVDSSRSINVDGYGYIAELNDKIRENRKQEKRLLNTGEVKQERRGVSEEKLGNEDLGFERYEDEDEAIYLVAKFIEVHEELLRYSGYNLWLLIEMNLYEENITPKQSLDLQKVLTKIVSDADLNINEQISEVLGAISNDACKRQLKQYFAS